LLSITLVPLYSIGCKYSKYYEVSSDGNEILLKNTSKYSIGRYTQCFNGSFLSNFKCSQCSSNCSTCHINKDLCLSCSNNSYALENGVCFDCYKKLTGCLTCSNTSYCLSCDVTRNFTSTPVNGQCVCPDYFYLTNNNSCIPCDSKSICKTCKSESECLSCNTQANWKQTPVSGVCVCADFYFNSFNKCINCDFYAACIECVS